MGRTGTIGSAIAIIALLGATLVPTAASAVGESDQDTRTPKTETVRAIVDLPSSMRLDSAIDLSNDLQGEVRGYRYSNGPLVGEFYPTATYTRDEFLKDFTARYKSSPRITGIVADFDSKSEAAAAENTLPQGRASFEPPAIDTSSLDQQLADQTAQTRGERARSSSSVRT